ncbi:Uma2 family endonuclease [Paludisphaera mucosa]|uniref:Uma2 family endonuclease n=1 Tax=Paludisphaera mucosa TaxID=3030827 RepID=A0ABT6F647_9BACT|nr:Uma2 family endonuclease [Paludisphaera mucosa]MDG3002884.1 Uma2 family endonuclease [Paludisphaera mucosa]
MSVELETEFQTVQDVIDQVGGVPPSRIRMKPTPGSATEADAIALHEKKRALCELVDGVLVEKGMGYVESLIAGAIYAMIRGFVRARKLGVASVADGPYLIAPGLILIPDVAFVSWERCPGGRVSRRAVAEVVPDLAVEVLSASNTRAEMDRKRQAYFDAGTSSVWMVSTHERTIAIYDRGIDEPRKYGEGDVIELQEILPGFRLSLAELFGELDEIEGVPPTP